MARQTEVRYISYYMVGSAACQVEPFDYRKKKEVKLPKQRKNKKIVLYLDPMAVLGIVVAFTMFVLMIAGAVRLSILTDKAEQMGNYAASLQVQNEQLRATYEAGFDLEEIRQIAEARGMVSMDQAQQVKVHVSVPQEVQEPSAWDNFLTFLTGLFA